MHPFLSGRLEPDISYFAFAPLDTDSALGCNTDPGWYFVIQEQPIETRFGLNVAKQSDEVKAIASWEELSWQHVGTNEGQYLDLLVNQVQTANLEPGWSTSAAAMASITMQGRVRLLIHASRIIHKTKSDDTDKE